MKYLQFAACERFGMDPEVFETKPVSMQLEMVAYELIRQREEQSGAEPK